MLNYLLVPFVKQFGFLRIFNYISFRAAGAAVTALLVSFIVGPIIIRRLRRMRLHQVIREGTPDTHREKKRTPTMGGLIFLFSALVATVLWARVLSHYVILALVVTIGMGGIGLVDDLLSRGSFVKDMRDMMKVLEFCARHPRWYARAWRSRSRGSWPRRCSPDG